MNRLVYGEMRMTSYHGIYHMNHGIFGVFQEYTSIPWFIYYISCFHLVWLIKYRGSPLLSSSSCCSSRNSSTKLSSTLSSGRSESWSLGVGRWGGVGREEVEEGTVCVCVCVCVSTQIHAPSVALQTLQEMIRESKEIPPKKQDPAGIEPRTFWILVRCSYHWAIGAPGQRSSRQAIYSH